MMYVRVEIFSTLTPPTSTLLQTTEHGPHKAD
jgi:hypothetical protein